MLSGIVGDDADRHPTIAIVVDACRTREGIGDNADRGAAPTRSMVKPDTELPLGMLVALSTGAGQIARDSGVYAKVLAEQINESAGLPLASMFDEVMGEVARRTGQLQIPVQQSKIVAKVCLASCSELWTVNPMAALRSAIELRATGDVGQINALERMVRDSRASPVWT